MIGAADAAAPVDERIEHQVRELVGELEADLLRAGCGFARELRERIGEIAPGQAEQSREAGRQCAVVDEKALDRVGDVRRHSP